MTIVSTIAAAIAGSVGITAGALVPICAICLIAVLKVGKETFCGMKDLDIKIPPG
jgi:hypothetical protein